MNQESSVKIQFHGRAFNTKSVNRHEDEQMDRDDSYFISEFNEISDVISDEIIQEVKGSLPIGVGISGEIEFHRGSIGWQGVLEILTWSASVGGTIGLVEYLSKLVKGSIARVMRRHINSRTKYYRSIETKVVIDMPLTTPEPNHIVASNSSDTLISEQNTIRKKYDIALATRNFEIELFWKRSIFFWGFIASAFVGYGIFAQGKESLAVIIACFGFVCSVAWSLVNRGSKYWQENWESIVVRLENEVTGELFNSSAPQQKKGIWLTSRKFSVSKVVIALSDFTALIWFTLMMSHLTKEVAVKPVSPSSYLIVLLVGFTIIFTIIMSVTSRSSEHKG
jgi:hypothetical protein